LAKALGDGLFELRHVGKLNTKAKVFGFSQRDVGFFLCMASGTKPDASRHETSTLLVPGCGIGSIKSLSHFLSFGHRRERQTKKDFSPADLAGEKHFAPQAQATDSAHCFVNGLKRSLVCLVRPAWSSEAGG
jgi:hypothetical protein